MITKDEILKMGAGYEMDKLIAEYIFNENEPHLFFPVWDKRNEKSAWSFTGDYVPKFVPRPYSIDIFSAWRIVEHFTGKDCRNQDFFIECWSDGEWFVSFHPLGYSTRFPSASCDGKRTGHPSAPLAICRAALLAVIEDK